MEIQGWWDGAWSYWWQQNLHPSGYDSFVPSMLPGLEKARQALIEFLVFFLVKGGNKSIDSNTQSFLVNWLISPLFASSGEARQRDGSVPSHGVSASHPPAAHVRGALVIWSWRFETIPMEDLRIYWVVMVVFVWSPEVDLSHVAFRLNLLGSAPSGELSRQLQGCPATKAGVDFAPLVADVGSIMMLVGYHSQVFRVLADCQA